MSMTREEFKQEAAIRICAAMKGGHFSMSANGDVAHTAVHCAEELTREYETRGGTFYVPAPPEMRKEKQQEENK